MDIISVYILTDLPPEPGFFVPPEPFLVLSGAACKKKPKH